MQISAFSLFNMDELLTFLRSNTLDILYSRSHLLSPTEGRYHSSKFSSLWCLLNHQFFTLSWFILTLKRHTTIIRKTKNPLLIPYLSTPRQFFFSITAYLFERGLYSPAITLLSLFLKPFAISPLYAALHGSQSCQGGKYPPDFCPQCLVLKWKFGKPSFSSDYLLRLNYRQLPI